MNTSRVNQIKESLAGLGTTPEQGYSNKEIISRLIELESALLAGVYEKNHAENIIKPFMERNGFIDGAGWWIKEHEE